MARELYKTHPDRLITGGAYSGYVRPPESIERFSPNVAVILANRNRPGLVDPAVWQSYWELVSAWNAKLAPGRLIRYENNRYDRSLVIHPRAYARDLRVLKGISLGDTGEVMRGTSSNGCWPNQWPNPAVNHLNIYVHSRLLWDADLDLDALLETPFHSYYQIEVNPDGVVFDSNRAYGERGDHWNSMVDVATERGEDYWRVTLRLPIMPEETSAGDPLHNVVGDKPSAEAPWFFNVGRARVRGVGEEDRTSYAFSPTGTATYHQKGRFVRLVIE